MNNLPKILVLGATGKVGSETLRQLQLAGDSRPIAAVRSAEKAQALQARGIDTVILDLDQPNTLEPALQGIDRALLLTGYSVDMLRQSKRFLDAAKVAGVNHIVHIGASTAPTNEVAHWGWHQMVEAYIEQQGFSFVHLRPEAFMQNITGPGYRWLDGNIIRHYVGNARWSWIDCNDLALVAAHVLREPEKYAGQTIPLGYDAQTFDEVAAILSQVTGQPIYAEARPPEEFLANALAAGADPAYMTCVYTQFKLNGEGAIPHADATFDNFESITGRPPTTWQMFAEQHQNELTQSIFKATQNS
ncbi:MAG: SDR family oxidoreductase [Cyanobacteria bacterium P01_D01_bin.115]